MPIELARAKVNLCLHVTGQREDGMHLLDSIVVFPSFGDELEAVEADVLTLAIEGPFSDGLYAGTDNLVCRAAHSVSDKGAALKLRKNLPIASGIGGGSADAAACIRLLSDLWDVEIPSIAELTSLGADVPVCIKQVPTRMSGIGEELAPLPVLPKFWMVLANAGQGVETGAVFKSMESRNNAGMQNIPDRFQTVEDLFVFLKKQRNDMQVAATKISPVITDLLNAIEATQNCALSRMSGSGGTCFGLFYNAVDAASAVVEIGENHPDWWVVSAEV